MENLINKIKELEIPQIIIFGMCLIAFIFLCYGIFFDGQEEDTRTISNTLELPEDGKAVTNFESKMDAYGVQEEKGSGIDLDFGEDFFSNDGDVRDSLDKMDRMQKLNDQIEQIESKKGDQHVYSEEDDLIIQELQKEIEKEKTVPPPPTQKSDYPKTPELTYEEKLRKAREARVSHTAKEEEPPAEIFQTKAVIYRDQFKLPGELVELALTEDFKYNDKIFKRGTLLYADLNIEKNRVLFNITNIAHIPMNIEVRDIRDGRVGMYSTKAGELWQKYESEALDDTANAVEQEVGAGTGSRILSTSINTISSFFKKKKLKQNEKILLLNDQELIVHIKKEQ